MQPLWQKIADILLLSRLEKRWQKVARALAVVVVFCTTYMLILPAITMENEPFCGITEHTHSEGCYSVLGEQNCELQEHIHQEYCFIKELATNGNVTGGNITDGNVTENKFTDGNISEEEKTEDHKTTESPEDVDEVITDFFVSFFTDDEASSPILTEEPETTDEAPWAEEDYGISVYADAQNPVTRINYDDLDTSGGTYYVVYTYYNNNYYAIDGNGRPVSVTVNSNGAITSGSMSNNLYWNFTLQSESTFVIQNLGTSRYMHSYNNSSTDYGVTTAGGWTSELITTGSGSSKTFSVKSNSNYSRLTGSGSSVAFSTTTTASSAAQFYLAEVYIPQDTYHVWFDGTCGGLMSLYESDNTYMAVPAENTTITLPTTWKSPSKYDYTLNGWYDIKNHVYYKPGATVTVTKNTVFYADWVASTYDVGIVDDDNVGLIAPSLDTNTFIRTDMFDYSAVFNMQAVTHTGSVNASSHSETWSIVQNDTVPYNNAASLGFTFRDWDTGDKHISYAKERARLNNNMGTEITTGIVDYVYDMSGRDIIDILFNPDSQIIGKNYVGQANYLYQFMEEGSENYDGEHDGYYYYDSKLNAASYNQSNQRFYIYEYLERTSDSLKDGFDSNGNATAGGSYSDFLPFNSPYANNSNNKIVVEYDDADGNGPNYQYDAKATNQSSAIENVGTNYWFGMKSEIQFYLPDDTGTVDAYQNYGNISSHGQHMTFEFSGDDDLWVFIDGELVMDIGGLHGIMEGKIDFSTGIITTSTANDVLETGTAATVTKTLDLSEGDHTLTVYYMERGGSQSNCAIYFNITPRYGIELVKQDSVSGGGLDGAEFAVYTDMECTQPATLWTSETAYQNGEDSTNTFTAINGKVSFWGISAGKVYYIKEVTAPVGYPITDDIIRISMNNLGNSICKADALRGDDGVHTEGFDIINNSANEAQQQIAISVTNQEWSAFKRNIAVTKYWDVEDITLIPESVTVYLTANGQSTGRSAVLSEVNGWTYVWTELPVYDSAGNTITYGVYEEQAEDFYTDVEVSEEVPFDAWIQTDAFYDGGTFLIVNRSTGNALAVNSSGDFEWIDFETAKTTPSAHWIVNADGMGFHVVDEEGYHIILDGTDEFIPDKNGNRILYYHEFALAARNNNAYYYINNNFSASTESILELELYINKDVLINENEAEDDSGEEEESGEDEIFVTMYTVTNTHIDEENRTSFNVKKDWADGVTNHLSDSITVHLYANGVDTGRSLVLNNANGWEAIFEGLSHKDEDGNIIEYTVLEDSFSGYYPEYSDITQTDGLISDYKWESVSSLSDGKLFAIHNGTYALTRNGTSFLITTYKSGNITENQLWLATADGTGFYLSDPEGTSYLYYDGGTASISASDKTLFTYSSSNGRISFTSSNRTRYIRINGSSLTTTTSTNSVTSFSLMKGTPGAAYSITVTNIKAPYLLPETGGTGTNQLYIIGGLLITLSAVFLLCLYKKGRGRRRRDFG